MCLHENTIECYPSAEVVCTDCGLVMEKILEQYNNVCVIVDEYDDIVIREELDNLMHNMHLPVGLKDEIVGEYKEHRINKELSSFKNNELLGFTIYDNLIKNQTPRLLDEICWNCHVQQTRIWSIQKIVKSFHDLDPILLVDRVIDELNIPYYKKSKIIETIRKIEDFSCAKPETITACAIYIHTNNEYLEAICVSCGISKSSVTSLYKRYRKHHGSTQLPAMRPDIL